MNRKRISGREKGSVLVLFALAITTIIGAMGLSVDIGRMYMAKTEGQAYADAAALAGVVELNGTLSGIAAAKTQIESGVWKRWNFSNTAYTTGGGSPQVRYWFCTTMECDSSTGSASPSTGAEYRYVRVETTAPVEMFLLPILTGTRSSTVWAGATAGQMKETVWTDGLWPFFVFDHSVPDDPAPPAQQINGYGFAQNQWYTFAWGNKAGEQIYNAFTLYGGGLDGQQLLAQGYSSGGTLTNIGKMAKYLRGEDNSVTGQLKIMPRDEWCPGDASERFLRGLIYSYINNGEGYIFTPDSNGVYNTAIQTLMNDKGFFKTPDQGNSGTSVIVSAITQGLQDGTITEGSSIPHYPGQRVAVQTPIVQLIDSDPSNNPESNTNVDLYWTRQYNDARVVYSPIVNANSSLGNKQTSQIISFRAFLLLTEGPCGNNTNNCNSYYQSNPSPRQNWCFAYMGDELKNGGGRPPAMGGIFVARLIR